MTARDAPAEATGAATPVEAQFAQPFLVATALVHGKIGIAEVDGLGNLAVLALSDRIAGMARKDRRKGSLSIAVTRTDGRSVTVEATDPIGSPKKPLRDAQFAAKFRDCARNAVQPLSNASVRGRHRRPTAIIGTTSADETGWRNRKFADSPLEGSGFELSVPPQKESPFRGAPPGFSRP